MLLKRERKQLILKINKKMYKIKRLKKTTQIKIKINIKIKIKIKVILMKKKKIK
jgi:hypothetical protein